MHFLDASGSCCHSMFPTVLCCQLIGKMEEDYSMFTTNIGNMFKVHFFMSLQKYQNVKIM